MAFTEVERRVVFEQLRGARADLHALVDQVSALVDLGLGRQAAETRQTEALVAAIGDSTATLAEAIGTSVRGGAERIRAALVLPAEGPVPDETDLLAEADRLAEALAGELAAHDPGTRPGGWGDDAPTPALLEQARWHAAGMGMILVDTAAVLPLARALATFPWLSERDPVSGGDLVDEVNQHAVAFLRAIADQGIDLLDDGWLQTGEEGA